MDKLKKFLQTLTPISDREFEDSKQNFSIVHLKKGDCFIQQDKICKQIAFTIGSILLVVISCSREEFNRDIEIPDFNFPKTVVFEDSLSSYEIFEGPPSDLSPAEGFELLELSAVLFTDYAHKQRLIKLPVGTQMTKSS